jgi:hypothetical protein
VEFAAAASRNGIVAMLAFAGLAGISAAPARADRIIEQEIALDKVRNIVWTTRDVIQRLNRQAPGAFAFGAEESEFDPRRPFEQSARHAFDALGYAKAPAKAAAAAAPVWLFGVNAIGAVDETRTVTGSTTAASGTGALDVTKIGIFTASDALTFVATGTGIWAHTFGLDIDTAAGAGTLAYTNGGFSSDFTASATWSRPRSLIAAVVAPPNSSSVSYTGNVQYKYDLPYSLYVEPTIGVTYMETYTANFGARTGNATELHVGGRVGTEMTWMGYKIQPQFSGQVFKNVIQAGVLAGAVPGLPLAIAGTDAGLGGRGAARINVIWTPNFSSFLDVHASALSSTKTFATLVGTQTIGGSAGMRYSW